MKFIFFVKTVIVCISLSLAYSNIEAQEKGFYVETNDKRKKADYYFSIMDSIALSDKKDTLTGCQNCINFMEGMSGIYASSKTTYFGRFYFTQKDLFKWHLWFDRHWIKK